MLFTVKINSEKLSRINIKEPSVAELMQKGNIKSIYISQTFYFYLDWTKFSFIILQQKLSIPRNSCAAQWDQAIRSIYDVEELIWWGKQ